MIKKALLALALVTASVAVSAQSLRVATGGKDGTYDQMFNELKNACQTSLVLDGVNTNGSVTNVSMLMGNQVNAAIVQGDVLKFRSYSDPAVANQLKSLFTLHLEEVHIVARADGKKEGGWGFGNYKIGGTTVVLRDFQDLDGRPVGAVGGSLITAKIMAANSGVRFHPVEFKTNDAMLDALRKNDIDAAVMVMGAPAPLIKGMSDEFRLLPITGKPAQDLSDIYSPLTLTYENLSNSQGVPAIATQAYFITRDYTTPAMVEGLNKFRECKEQKLAEIKETLGTHPKWQQVQNDNVGKWPVYNRK